MRCQPITIKPNRPAQWDGLLSVCLSLMLCLQTERTGRSSVDTGTHFGQKINKINKMFVSKLKLCCSDINIYFFSSVLISGQIEFDTMWVLFIAVFLFFVLLSYFAVKLLMSRLKRQKQFKLIMRMKQRHWTNIQHQKDQQEELHMTRCWNQK